MRSAVRHSRVPRSLPVVLSRHLVVMATAVTHIGHSCGQVSVTTVAKYPSQLWPRRTMGQKGGGEGVSSLALLLSFQSFLLPGHSLLLYIRARGKMGRKNEEKRPEKAFSCVNVWQNRIKVVTLQRISE